MSARVTREQVKLADVSESLMRKRLRSGKFRVDEDGMLEKHCPKCNEYWPADTEFFFSAGNKGDGLTCWCKACYVEWRYPDGRGGVGHQFGVQARRASAVCNVEKLESCLSHHHACADALAKHEVQRRLIA